jgi:hypothetical protein
MTEEYIMVLIKQEMPSILLEELVTLGLESWTPISSLPLTGCAWSGLTRFYKRKD